MTITGANLILSGKTASPRFYFAKKDGNWLFDGEKRVFPCTAPNGSGKPCRVLDIHVNQAISYALHRLKVEARQTPTNS